MAHPQYGKPMLQHFNFASSYRNLNNGSFGAAPTSLLIHRQSLQSQTEVRPDPFIRYEQGPLLQKSRAAVAELLNAPLDTIVLIPNATNGINTVLRNLAYAPGDKILTFSTAYGANTKTIQSICETTVAQPVVVPLDYPSSDAEILKSFEDAIRSEQAQGNKVKVVVFDTISSMPAMRLPFEDLVKLCKRYDVLSCVDGAHGIGQIPLDLTQLDADFFVSNLHKWLYVPRSCAVFFVPKRNQHLIRTTLPTSHAFAPRGIDSTNERFGGTGAWDEMFDFVGTLDLSSYFCVPEALRFRREIGGEDAIMSYNAELAARGGALVAQRLGTDMIYSKGNAMVNVRLPLKPADALPAEGGEAGVFRWIERRINDDHDGFMAVFWHAGAWWTRLSAQIWVDIEDFEWAAETLSAVCRRVRGGEHKRPVARL